jgi:hypothetical protein
MQMLKISTCFIALLALSLITFHTGCKKEKIPDDPMKVKLPPPTQEGLNTVGCRINGVPFVRSRGFSIYPEKDPLQASYDFRRKIFQIIARRFNLKENDGWITTVVLLGSTFDKEGVYDIESGPLGLSDTSSVCGDFSYGQSSSYYDKLFHVIRGRMNITRFDRELKIVAGTFEYDAYSKKCRDTVRITEGRFDVKF